jgi:predicted 3-demethylubiquinone-9 3-methyltransferase (glyoxalase superfamily)
MDLYCSVFPAAKVVGTMPGPNGSLMGATFELDSQRFTAFNSGADQKLTSAVSMYVNCETQAEVDELLAKLTDGGEESRCGWLIDRFGLSWQIIPSFLPALPRDPDREKAGRVMNAMLAMKKIDIAALDRAAAEEGAERDD